jgi:SAM-dependent methyltransferase
MVDQPEPLTPFDIRHKEIRDGIEDTAQRELFDSAVARLDREALSQVYDKYKSNIAGPGFAGFEKYLDVCFWLRDKIARACAMGLQRGEPRRLLDLGAGAGHWLAACAAMGHEGVGLDIEVPIFVDLCRALRVDRRTFRIQPGEALPGIGRFDVVTAFAVKFDALGRDPQGVHLYWSPDDWDFFLRDVTTHRMRYPGKLHLQLNSRIRPDGQRERFTDVMKACREAGAAVVEMGSRIEFNVSGPIGLGVSAASPDRTLAASPT